MKYPMMPIHGVDSLSYFSSNSIAEEQARLQRMNYKTTSSEYQENVRGWGPI